VGKNLLPAANVFAPDRQGEHLPSHGFKSGQNGDRGINFRMANPRIYAQYKFNIRVWEALKGAQECIVNF